MTSSTEGWEVLKDKCIDCYELNRYREMGNCIAGYLTENMPILDVRYCPTHQKVVDELYELVRSQKE